MDGFYNSLDDAIVAVSEQYGIRNLIASRNIFDNNDYWPRLARFKFFNKLFGEHRYHFLYEIQGLSSQLHFGVANCFLLREKISHERGRPNVYNHRYTFMIESSIHCIYAFWNRVGLVLNTYLKKPIDIKRTYFSFVIQKLLLDYPELEYNDEYIWIVNVKNKLDALNRNEFAHNNSLIMQNFLPKYSEALTNVDLLAYPELLLSHNKLIVDDIDNLINLIAKIESLVVSE